MRDQKFCSGGALARSLPEQSLLVILLLVLGLYWLLVLLLCQGKYWPFYLNSLFYTSKDTINLGHTGLKVCQLACGSLFDTSKGTINLGHTGLKVCQLACCSLCCMSMGTINLRNPSQRVNQLAFSSLPSEMVIMGCCYVTVDSAMAASQNGFCSYKLSIHKKNNIM